MIVELLREIAQWEEARFIVRNDAAIAEICGKARIREGDEYVTIEITGSPDHLHLRRAGLARAAFVPGKQRNCSVRLLGPDGRTPVLNCYLPRSGSGKDDFDPHRREQFDSLLARYSGRPEIVVLSEEA